MPGILLAEVAPTITLSSDWYSPLLSMFTGNGPVLLVGFMAIMGVSAGLGWIMKNAKGAVKKAS